MYRFNAFETVITEFGRALAAARRYKTLRYSRARHDGLASADIPRRIFEEFYAHQSAFAPPDIIGRDPIDISRRLRAWRAATIKALMSSALSTIFAALRETLRRAGGRFTVFR